RETRARELGVDLDQAELSLEIGGQGRWFRPPRGQRVELGRRHVLQKLLMRLVEMRRDAPGTLLTVEDALAAGWPGEVLARKAAANRVRVAVSTLRKLGLKRVLLTRGDGYLLDPEVPVVTGE